MLHPCDFLYPLVPLTFSDPQHNNVFALLEQLVQQKSEDFAGLEQKMKQTMLQRDREQRQTELASNKNIENFRKLKGILSEIRQRYCAEIFDLRQGTYVCAQPISQHTLSLSYTFLSFERRYTYATLTHTSQYIQHTHPLSLSNNT